MDKNLLDLFLEYMRGNPLWDDFVNALDEYNKEQILAPIQELERIRTIDANTDQVFVDKSVRQLGLAINNMLLASNRDNIRKVFGMLPLYHELSGTPKFPRFIEFLLGKGFRATPLYTVDYIDFYPKPKGPLVIDGGPWYCTTHVELSVDVNGLEDVLSLQIEQRDMNGLLEAGFTLEEINPLRGIDLESDKHNRFIVDHIIQNRIIELYYGFAPIEDVVRQVHMAIPAQGDVFIAGSVAIKAKEYIKLDAPGIKRLDVTAPNIVYGFEPYQFNMKVTLSDDTEFSHPTNFIRTEPEGMAEGNVGKVVFKDVLQQTQVDVVVQYEGSEFYHTVQLVPSGVPAIPESISIQGKSRVLEGIGAKYTLIGKFGDERYPVLDQDNVKWSIDTDSAHFEGSKLVIGEIYSNQSAQIKAEYYDNDNVLHTRTMDVTLVDSVKEIKPIGLTINVPDELLQGQSYPITVDALYSDGSTKAVNAHLKAASNKAKFNYEGVVYSPVVSRDYDTTFIAEFQDKGVSVREKLKVTFIYPKLEVFKLTAIVPEKVKEHTRLALRCVAHWCKASDLVDLENGVKTEDQVQLFTSETDAAWTHIGQHTFEAGTEGFDFDTLVTSVEEVRLEDNLFIAPEVDETSDMVLQARVTTESGRNVTTTKYLQITPIESRINNLLLAIRQKLFEGESNKMSIVAEWTDGKQTELHVGTHDDYTLSVSVKHEDGLVHPQLYFDNNILRYEGVISGLATVTVDVQYTHTNADGGVDIQSIKETALVSVVPKIVLTDSIRVYAAESNVMDDSWVMLNRSRMFIRTEAEFEDGTVEDIAPDITPVMFVPYEEQDVPLSVVTGVFSLRDMVSILTNKTPEEIYAELSKKYYGYFQVVYDAESSSMIFTQTPESTTSTAVAIGDIEDLGILRNHPALAPYAEFESIKTVLDLEQQLTRTLIQASKINEETELQLQFRYFKEELEQTLIIQEREVPPHNLILSKRITGPMEFYANVPAVSYALYVNFDDGGEEYGVSNDWELTILNKRQVLLDLGMNFEIEDFANKTDEQLDQIVPTNKLVDIDENGYVYPKENVSALLRITAKFDDGKTKLEDSIDVQMRRANTYLDRISIVGPSTIEDIGDSNFITDGSMSYVPYKALLWRVGSGVPEEVHAYWRLEQASSESEQDLVGINVGADTGKLFVKTQIENQDIFLVCYYEEQFDDRMEWVEKRKRVFINANKAVNQVEIDAVPAIVNDDGLLQLTATLTLEDSSQVPLSSGYNQEWIITDSPEGVTINESGQLNIPKLHTDSNVTVTLNVHSGSITVENSVTFLVTARNSLQDLRIAGYQNVRDDSVIQLQAVLFRNNDVVNDFPPGQMEDPSFCGNKECVTDKCQWSIKRIDGENIENVFINEATGLLTINSVPKAFTLEVTAVYTEKDQPSVSHSLVMTIHSSLPRFGQADWGLTNANDMASLTGRVKNLKKGGSFNLNVDPPQGQVKYGYFAHRKDIGKAVIKSIKNNPAGGSWGGANWPAIGADYTTETERQNIVNQYGDGPIEIEVTYDNVVDTWYLYRTERNNFGFDEFAYYYEVEQQ